MIEDTFLAAIEKSLPFELTKGQKEVIRQLASFTFSAKENLAYVLRGFAGTGKTTIVASIVKLLKRFDRDVVLLAPTGRAAKVLSHHAGYPAFTIHKEIYRQRQLGDIDASFDLDQNKHKHAIFIVDEASMIANDYSGMSPFGSGRLLDDLVRYVYSSTGCRMILVGDKAQLPPVGEEESPALMLSTMRNMGLEVTGYQLAVVMRQAQESGILSNATNIRRHITEQETSEMPTIKFSGFDDIHNMPGNEIVESLESDYDNYGLEEVVVLTRSNKRAVEYNRGIRNMIFGREGLLTAGDVVMIVRNNYYWTEMMAAEMKSNGENPNMPINFFANGDIALVKRIKQRYDFYDMQFADVTLQFPDYDYFEMDVRVLLDALTSESPSLTKEQSEKLYQGVMEDYALIKTKKERMKKLRLDPNFNAVQIKYAYAVTCHKAQGGQWRNVYIDQGWLPPDGIDKSYYRWLYTAFTRATDKLYLINWPEKNSE